MKKKILSIIILFICILSFHISEATDEVSNELMNSQKESLNIKSFISEAQKYSGEVLEDTNISELLNSAIKGEIDNSTLFKKVISLLGTEVRDSLTLMRKHLSNYCST